MVRYQVTVFTANLASACTDDDVYIKLVGTEGESDRTWLMDNGRGAFFYQGAVSSFSVSCHKSIGKLVLIEVDKQRRPPLPEDDWYVSKVEVKSPEGHNYKFPIYRWIGEKVYRFREATAVRDFEDNHDLCRHDRQQELKRRKEEYRWKVYAEGIPHIIKAESPMSLPEEVRFSFTKDQEFKFTSQEGIKELMMKGLDDCKENWTDLDAINRVFSHRKTDMSEYVQQNWRDDSFFGYQYLNGVNPILIQRCTALPNNFAVDHTCVNNFLLGPRGLENELRKGNIFLCDYKLLDGVKPNKIDGKQQYLMAPLVLFYRTPDDSLVPIAIQLKQTPADDNPVFYPSDSEYDWLTAKIFVRSADFSDHQLNAHLLRTHLLAEVFAVSLLRNLPMVHPLYKLLIPHTRYTLQINVMARNLLISERGHFAKFAASGGEGLSTILQRSMSALTYSSLCIREDIAARGMEAVPNYHYRDDGFKMWDIIHRFVKGILSYYYKRDYEVEQDQDVQNWIRDIFEHGFLSRASTGIPQSFCSVDELVKFVTMVIFTCSVQHHAVNSGQFDFSGWMPNAPISLQRPPPTTKGTTNEATMLQTLPNIAATVNGMATLWLLSKRSSDFVSLGHYPEEYFREETPRQVIKDFQRKLGALSEALKIRNDDLIVPYKYNDPRDIENSVAI